MEPLSRLAGPGRILLAGAALCAAGNGMATDKRTLTIGATLVPSNHCRVSTATGVQCAGAATPPALVAGPFAGSIGFQGSLVVKLSATAASLDSRQTAASDPVVLTIAP